MKKRIISAIAILALMFGAAVMPQANAQIFVTDNEEAVGVARNPDGSLDLPAMPILDVTYDQMAPLGEGLLLLTAMGGLYLMGKRRKDGGHAVFTPSPKSMSSQRGHVRWRGSMLFMFLALAAITGCQPPNPDEVWRPQR